jgi:hypothetical protein
VHILGHIYFQQPPTIASDLRDTFEEQGCSMLIFASVVKPFKHLHFILVAGESGLQST